MQQRIQLHPSMLAVGPNRFLTDIYQLSDFIPQSYPNEALDSSEETPIAAIRATRIPLPGKFRIIALSIDV